MPDLVTASISAGAKPLFKIILKHRPAKLKKLAKAAEDQVTHLMAKYTVFLEDNEFQMVTSQRKSVTAARERVESTRWSFNLKKGFEYMSVVYVYYSEAQTLLMDVKNITTARVKERGPEAMRAEAIRAATAGASETAATGQVTSFAVTMDNVPLKPGTNSIKVELPGGIPRLATVTISTKPLSPSDAPPQPAVEEGPFDDPDEDSVSVQVTVTSGDDNTSECDIVDEQGDEDNDDGAGDGDDGGISFELSNLSLSRGRRRTHHGISLPSLDIEFGNDDD